MNYRLIAGISRSLLMARLGQTVVAAIGVTFSITMFIALLSFMTGLNNILDSLIVNRTPHVRLYNEIKPNDQQPVSLYKPSTENYHFIHSVKPKKDFSRIRNSLAIIQSLRQDNRVMGVAPKLSEQVFYNVGSVDLTGIINGVDPVEENRLFFLDDYITTGSSEALKNTTNGIILGKGIADIMMSKIGDVVTVTTARGNKVQLKVVGFFQSGLADYDKVNSFTSLTTAQKIAEVASDYITDLQIKLFNIKQAPTLAAEFKKIYGIQAVDIQAANSQFETGTFVRTLISYSVGITLLVVAGFGIYNILNMMIYEKMDTIAILKATGFTGKDIKWIFIGIALFIGFFGGVAGLIIGYVLSAVIDIIPFETQALPTITTYPVNYNPFFYLIAISFSIVTTYLAGFFPARKASRVDPVIIIRGK
ncbi:MAG: FtsX-like permease family protein [Bacteroidia bacterium]|nr:ABC transporter permease [Bacteroidia bacterium]MCZ2277932.1 FtsX-like permease family protein [Bacteroidia bacterium]